MCFTHSEVMMDFVDVFVDPSVMQQAMEEVMPSVLNDSTTKALGQEGWPGREELTVRKVIISIHSHLTDWEVPQFHKEAAMLLTKPFITSLHQIIYNTGCMMKTTSCDQITER